MGQLLSGDVRTLGEINDTSYQAYQTTRAPTMIANAQMPAANGEPGAHTVESRRDLSEDGEDTQSDRQDEPRTPPLPEQRHGIPVSSVSNP